MKRILLLVVITIITIPVFPQSKKIWQGTYSKNNLAAYIDFQKKYPYSKYGDIVIQKIDSFEWVIADSIGTIISYSDYFEKNKHGYYRNPAVTKYNELIRKYSLQLTKEQINGIKEELQLLSVPFNFYDLQYFFSNKKGSTGQLHSSYTNIKGETSQFSKDYKSLEASCYSSKYSFWNVVRPNSSLYTHLVAKKDKVELLTTTSPMSMADFMASEEGIPSKGLNPKRLFVLTQPLKYETDSIGFAEIKIFGENEILKDHLLIIKDIWYSIKQ